MLLVLSAGILAVPFCAQILVHWLSVDALKSSTDPLTGLRNRRGFYRSASKLFAAETRTLCLSVVMLDGSDALRALVESLPPDSHHTVEHVVADGDLVLFQTDLVITPGTKGLATIDVFRVQDGKIAEHWDTLQQEPEQTASGNDMFATLTSPRTSATSATANTALSRAVVLDYFTDLTKHRDLRAVDRYVAPDLVQHDPALADGAAATKAAYAQRFKADPGFTATVASVVAEGDYVVVHSHYRNSAGDLGQSVYEIFRVQHGKIVEHWSDTQDVPATSANGNTMF